MFFSPDMVACWILVGGRCNPVNICIYLIILFYLTWYRCYGRTHRNKERKSTVCLMTSMHDEQEW